MLLKLIARKKKEKFMVSILVVQWYIEEKIELATDNCAVQYLYCVFVCLTVSKFLSEFVVYFCVFLVYICVLNSAMCMSACYIIVCV